MSGNSYQPQQQPQQQQNQQTPPARQEQQSHGGQDFNARRNSVVIKVGMVGDAQIGKTSLMVKYVEGSFDEDYIQTLGRETNFS